jgi:hypothetical protein
MKAANKHISHSGFGTSIGQQHFQWRILTFFSLFVPKLLAETKKETVKRAAPRDNASLS